MSDFDLTHLIKIIDDGASVWNRFISGHLLESEEPIDLTGANLQFRDLRSYNFSGCDLRCANLSSTFTVGGLFLCPAMPSVGLSG